MQKKIMLFDYPLVFFYVISCLTVVVRLFYIWKTSVRQMLNKRLNNDGQKRRWLVWIKRKAV